MIIAFLNLLDFSNLSQNDSETATDNLISIQQKLLTRLNDARFSPPTEYKNTNLGDFAIKHSATAYENIIHLNDKLVLTSNEVELFISQLSNFIASLFIEYSTPFQVPFNNLKEVKTTKIVSSLSGGNILPHNVFPILYRGGVAYGEDIVSLSSSQIHEWNENPDSDTSNKTYITAVNLEKSSDKGPHLFCDKSVVEQLSNKKMIWKNSNTDTYEIIWTIEGCETSTCSSDPNENVSNAMQKMLLPAINLYNYFKKSENTEPQYKELLTLICRGIMKYQADNCTNGLDNLSQNINCFLAKHGISDITFDDSLIENFLE